MDAPRGRRAGGLLQRLHGALGGAPRAPPEGSCAAGGADVVDVLAGWWAGDAAIVAEIGAALQAGRFVTIAGALPATLAAALHDELAAAQVRGRALPRLPTTAKKR